MQNKPLIIINSQPDISSTNLQYHLNKTQHSTNHQFQNKLPSTTTWYPKKILNQQPCLNHTNMQLRFAPEETHKSQCNHTTKYKHYSNIHSYQPPFQFQHNINTSRIRDNITLGITKYSETPTRHVNIQNYITPSKNKPLLTTLKHQETTTKSIKKTPPKQPSSSENSKQHPSYKKTDQ